MPEGRLSCSPLAAAPYWPVLPEPPGPLVSEPQMQLYLLFVLSASCAMLGALESSMSREVGPARAAPESTVRRMR